MSLALVGGILAVALIAVPRLVGGTPQHAAAQEGPFVAVNMDVTNGTGPCDINHMDATRNTAQGETYTVAVCLVNALSSPAAFQLDLLYNDQLNTCVVTPGDGNLDSNPDANAGTTLFPMTPTPSPGLGPGFDCTNVGSAPPSCDNDTATGAGHGDALLGCFQGNPNQTPTLPVGQGVSSVLFEVTFTASGVGTDTLSFLESGAVSAKNSLTYVDCGVEGSCIGGTDIKGTGSTSTPPPTATSTPPAAPTATPVCGFAGLPTCTPTPRAHTPTPTTTATATAAPSGGGAPAPPPAAPPSGGAGGNVRPPNTGDGSGTTPWVTSLEWIIGGAMVVTLTGGAFYVRRVRMRR